MSQQTINVGSAPNDGTGTPLRTAFQYTNSNFSELYTALGGGSGLPGATTQVIFNDGGTNLAGDAGLVYNKTTDALTIGGNVQAASATITGNIGVGGAINYTGAGEFYLQNSSSTNFIGINPTSNYIRFGTNNTVKATLDSSGNLGLGVTPSAWGSSYKAIQVAANGVLYANGSNSLFLGGNYYNDSGGTNRYLVSNAATAYGQVSGAHQWFTAASGTAGNAITFTQAMTLTDAGELLVGTTGLPGANGRISAKSSSPSLVPLRAFCDANDASPTVAFDKSSATNTTSQVFAIFTISNQSVGSGQINANGASQAAFGSFSDSRLKENIVSLPSQLANILSLRPVEFDYKDGSGHQIGFVAQEMQKVYSDAVGEQNGFLTVTGWSKTEARLVSAIKELAAKVQSLEAKLA